MQITEQSLLDSGYKKYKDHHNFSKYLKWTPDEWNTTGWFYMFIGSYDSRGDHGFSVQPNHPSRDEESVEYYETLF